MVANFIYARALIWGLAVSYFGLIMLICTLLCNDQNWRAGKVYEVCGPQAGSINMYNYGSGANGRVINDTGSGINGAQAGSNVFFEVFKHQFRMPDGFWPLSSLSKRIAADATPCEALIATNGLLEDRRHALMLVIGLLGSFFLVFTGESAVQTTRFIVRDLIGEDSVPAASNQRHLFPCLPWLYRYVAENIKVHRGMIRQKIVRINHDMKVPLAGLKSETSELSDTVERETVPQLQKRIRSLERYVNYIDQSADQLKLALGQQLTLNDLSVHAICLETELGELTEDISFIAAKRDIEIVLLNATNESHRTFGNMRFAREMLMILLDNAVQYSIPGSTIEVELKSRSSQTCLSIKNTGTPIPEELLTPDGLVQSAPSDGSGGVSFNGVGLSIAAGIADLHRWKLRFRGVKSKGQTIVTLTMPKINFEKKNLENAHISS